MLYDGDACSTWRTSGTGEIYHENRTRVSHETAATRAKCYRTSGLFGTKEWLLAFGGRERDHSDSIYSGTSLIQTPVGQKKVSFLVRCPHFRG